MNILVLGSSGYLGSKVVHAMVAQKHNVVCCIRKKTDTWRLKDVEGQIRYVLIDDNELESEMQNTSFDWIFNLAGNYEKKGICRDDIIESNFNFPLTILNKALESGSKQFLTIGTGLPANFNLYSFSKKMFSEFGRFYSEKEEIDFYCMQLEMFYGSDEPQNRFIPWLIRNMLQGSEINVTEGTQRRDIIAIEDVVHAIIKVSGLPYRGGGYFEIPVGTGIAPTVSEIVDYIWIETGCKSRLKKGAVSMRQDEPDCIADNKVIEEIGEWKPVFWKDGLHRMIREIKG